MNKKVLIPIFVIILIGIIAVILFIFKSSKQEENFNDYSQNNIIQVTSENTDYGEQIEGILKGMGYTSYIVLEVTEIEKDLGLSIQEQALFENYPDYDGSYWLFTDNDTSIVFVLVDGVIEYIKVDTSQSEII